METVDPENKRVLVAMSGGTDSSVTAALLKSQGYDVVGVHFVMCAGEKAKDRCPKAGGNCARPTEIDAVQAVAKQLGVTLYIEDLQEQYQNDVTDYVIHETLRFRKPNPCFICNGSLKIPALLKKADELQCKFVATGHYAKVVRSADGNETNVFRALDREYDQSHFFFSLKQEQLARILTPNGELLRKNIEKMARTFRITVEEGEKKALNTLCFVDSGQAKDLVKSQTSDRQRPHGPIVTQDGHSIGRHQGLYLFQLGDTAKPAQEQAEYHDFVVIGFEPRLNAVIMGPEKDVLKTGITVTNCNWIGTQDFSKGFSLNARIGMDLEDKPCSLTLLGHSSVWVEFTKPQRAIPLGQPIVFYFEETIIGGGWIETLVEPVQTKLRPKH